MLIGTLAGAILGGLFRFLVAIAFLHYVKGHDTWWGAEISDEEYHLTWVSAFIGMAIGCISGGTCRPKWGFILGAILSAGFCFGLFACPACAGIEISEGVGGKDELKLQVIMGLFAMTVAGGLAGGIGATFGHICSKRSSDPQTVDPN